MQGKLRNFKTGSQNSRILKYLQTGKSLTCLEALGLGFGMNLRSRVADLKRAGFDVISEQKNMGNCNVAEYSFNNG